MSAEVWKAPMFDNSWAAGAMVALTNRNRKHANMLTNKKSMLK
jgi:hypothetical protein